MAMHFAEAVRLCRAHVDRKFPKTCGMCGRVFANLPEYIRGTRHVGQPVSYDAAADDWEPKDPVVSQNWIGENVSEAKCMPMGKDSLYSRDLDA